MKALIPPLRVLLSLGIFVSVFVSLMIDYSWTSALSRSNSVTVFAYGDVAFCPSPTGIRGTIKRWFNKIIHKYKAGGHKDTGKQLDSTSGTILGLGDLAYNDGSSDNYQNCFDPAWGRHKNRIRPTPGNHDYSTGNADGYFGYFGRAAGPMSKGYYSFDLGDWHLISLNSNIRYVDLEHQISWLRDDLSKTKTRCILAYWHHPTFTAGRKGYTVETRALFEVIYHFGGSIVISGHEHGYERHAPQDATGKLDLDRGVRQFVVGTGGASLRNLDHKSGGKNLEAKIESEWGFLKLTLHPTGYQWEFLPTDSDSKRDKGSGKCVEK